LAAINGPAVGFGASILLPADIRIALGTARVRFLYARCGICCASWFLPRMHSLWAQVLAWLGRTGVLVSKAGIYEPANVDGDFATWERSWHRTLANDLLAPAHLCREAIRTFRTSGGGIINNIASRAAFRGGDPAYMHYAASKAGIVAMTRTIARAFGRDNITAFVVAPGFVRTPARRST
jgi:3-oxoacyl-[acyl-carrier protein] reductase